MIIERCLRANCNRPLYRSYDEGICFVHGTQVGDNKTGQVSNFASNRFPYAPEVKYIIKKNQ